MYVTYKREKGKNDPWYLLIDYFNSSCLYLISDEFCLDLLPNFLPVYVNFFHVLKILLNVFFRVHTPVEMFY